MVEACAGVFDAEGRAVGVHGRGDADAPAVGLHVHRVRDEVAQRLAELDPVGCERAGGGDDLDLPLGGVSLEGARGGADVENAPLLTAGGLDLGHFFENYTVHGQTDKAANYLAPMAVGRLSAADAEAARRAATPTAHTESRLRVLGKARGKILLVILGMPFWYAAQILVRVLGFVCPPLGHALARLLPVALVVVHIINMQIHRMPMGVQVQEDKVMLVVAQHKMAVVHTVLLVVAELEELAMIQLHHQVEITVKVE